MKSKLALALLLLFSLLSCKKADETTEDASSESDAKSLSIMLPAKYKSSEGAGALTSSESPTGTIEQKIIKNGNIKFPTDNLEATYVQVVKALKKGNAFVQNDIEGKEYSSIYRRLTIRIPSQNFDTFIKDISNGVPYFDAKEISAQDVTAEYIDLDARLKAKKKLESRYLELLSKATKMSEMLEIEAQLSAIREEVEAKEG